MNLDPVLIYTDTKSIIEKKAFLTKVVPLVQGIFDAFQAINIDINLSQVNNLFYHVLTGGNVSRMTESLVRDALVSEIGAQEINGVKIDLSSHIILPDISLILSKISAYHSISVGRRDFDVSKLQVVNGVVSKTPTADAEITESYSYYSQNDKGAEVASLLFLLAGNMNNWLDYIEITSLSLLEDIYGLELYNRRYRPDMSFIRRMERNSSNYIAPENE